MNAYEVIIVGAGLAGLTAALALSRSGVSVALIEKNNFPKHKVCGEYISNEVRDYLESFGLDLSDADPIQHLRFSTAGGRMLETSLPLGGFGISRFTLDHRLWKLCQASGVVCVQEKVEDLQVNIQADQEYPAKVVMASGHELRAKVLLATHGKRAALDRQLDRSFIQQKSPWVAFKEHYTSSAFPSGSVELHSFQGGYCGLSRTENGSVNLCFLIHQNRLNKGTSRDALLGVLSENPHLKAFLQEATPLFDRPMSIAQISFGIKESVENHILYAGDSAGLIHPLCGNGMAMAIHAASIGAQLISSFLAGEINRPTLESEYSKKWKKHFQTRMRTGRYIQNLIGKKVLSEPLVPLLNQYPHLVQKLIQLTHGEPLSV